MRIVLPATASCTSGDEAARPRDSCEVSLRNLDHREVDAVRNLMGVERVHRLNANAERDQKREPQRHRIAQHPRSEAG